MDEAGSGRDDSERILDWDAWIDYQRQGRAYVTRVNRAWNTFSRNAGELVLLLQTVETDILSALRLMESTGADDVEGGTFRAGFWEALDQRLHNMVAGAITVVDQTRPLVNYYDAHEPDFTAEWRMRSEALRDSPRAQFIKRLRNYLLHYGSAPMMQTMWLGSSREAEQAEMTVQLSVDGLLHWKDWGPGPRAFITEHKSGVPLRQVTRDYAQQMHELYGWLFQIWNTLHVPGEPPERFYR